jgi:hypothetical protein
LAPGVLLAAGQPEQLWPMVGSWLADWNAAPYTGALMFRSCVWL